MRTKQEIIDRIKEYENEISETFDFASIGIICSNIEELEWVLSGEDD